jgi:hypothetical protein
VFEVLTALRQAIANNPYCDAPMAWHADALGRIAMLSMTCDDDAGFIEVVVDGAITRADYEAVVTAVDQLLTRHRRIDFVEVVRRIGPIAPEVWWRDIVFHLHHRDFLHRAAVVSDSGWVGPLVRLFAPFYPAELRCFPEAALDAARRWARGADDAG